MFGWIYDWIYHGFKERSDALAKFVLSSLCWIYQSGFMIDINLCINRTLEISRKWVDEYYLKGAPLVLESGLVNLA